MTDFQFLARGIALAGCGIGAGCSIRGKARAGSLVPRSGEQTTRPIETR